MTLVDTAALGLKVSQNFIPVAVEEEEEADFDPFEGGRTRPGGDATYGGPIPPPFGGYSSGGTVGLDGTQTQSKGGTVGM